MRPDVLARALRAAADILEAAAHEETTTPSVLFDRDHLPPGAASWRAVLEAGRRGDLEVTRVGRNAVVTGEAWRSFVEARRGRPTQPARVELVDADARALEALGVVVPIRAAGGGR